jgi:hypothetical protein
LWPSVLRTKEAWMLNACYTFWVMSLSMMCNHCLHNMQHPCSLKQSLIR